MVLPQPSRAGHPIRDTSAMIAAASLFLASPPLRSVWSVVTVVVVVVGMTDYRARKSGSHSRYRPIAYINKDEGGRKEGRLKERERERDHPIESASLNYAESQKEKEIKSWFCGLVSSPARARCSCNVTLVWKWFYFIQFSELGRHIAGTPGSRGRPRLFENFAA